MGDGRRETSPSGTYQEIHTLADLDEACCRIGDEEGGWGLARHIEEMGCTVVQDLVEPSTVKLKWHKDPQPADYTELFARHLPPYDRRVDWGRGPCGVWEVLRIPAFAAMIA